MTGQSRERYRDRGSAAGFTLLELLVAVSIAVGLILLLATVYRQVLYTAEGLGAAESDWRLQQFLRRQLAARDARFDAFDLAKGDPTSLRFVTRLSAADGMAGPPVYVQYNYEPNDEALVYREQVLPPWWIDGRTGTEFRNLVRSGSGVLGRDTVLLDAVTDLRFEYRQVDGAGWQGDWLVSADEVSPLIRLRFDRLGEVVEWLLPTAYMGYALPAWQFEADAGLAEDGL